MDINSFLESVWDGILSNENNRIKQTYLSLDKENRQVVRNHLLRMTTETGWQVEQVRSASAALRVINTLIEN